MTKKRQKPKVKAYRVVDGVRNDKTGKYYGPDDIVTKADFNASLLEHWADKGALVEV